MKNMYWKNIKNVVKKYISKITKNSKNTLVDRIFMYIFVSFSLILGFGIVGTHAYSEIELVKHEIITLDDTIYMKIALGR